MIDLGISNDIFTILDNSTDEYVNNQTHDTCGICVKKRPGNILGRCENVPNDYGKSYRISNDKEGCGEAMEPGVDFSVETHADGRIRAFPFSGLGEVISGTSPSYSNCMDECAASADCKYVTIKDWCPDCADQQLLQPPEGIHNIDDCIDCDTIECSQDHCPNIIHNLINTLDSSSDNLNNRTEVECILHHGTGGADVTWKKSGEKDQMCIEMNDDNEPILEEGWKCHLTGNNWIKPTGLCLGNYKNYKIDVDQGSGYMTDISDKFNKYK